MGASISSEIFRKHAKKQARKEFITILIKHYQAVAQRKKEAVRYSVYAVVDLLFAVALIIPDGLSNTTKLWVSILCFALFLVFAVLTVAARRKIHFEYTKANHDFFYYGYEKRKDDVVDDEIGHLFGFKVPKNPSAKYKDILDIQKERIDKKKMEAGFALRLFDYYLDPVIHKH
jgi:hypothetical protein